MIELACTSALALVFLFSSCVSAYALARHALPAARASVRLAACWAVLAISLVATFFALSLASGFHALSALPLSLVALTIATRSRARLATQLRALQRDVANAALPVWGEAGRSARCLLVVAIGAASVPFLRAAVAPALGWDSLTYHLVKSARWVQEGGFATEVAPDTWGFYEFFPPFGSVLWAWALLPGDDTLLWIG
ncbi:MAG: hypothetical protein AAF517_12280, partial [Planctomycetota bacterium]